MDGQKRWLASLKNRRNKGILPKERFLPINRSGITIELADEVLALYDLHNGQPHKSATEIRYSPTRGWRLPGQGVQYESCGKSTEMGCLNQGNHVHFLGDNNGKYGIGKRIVHRCNRPGCPICSRNWMKKKTDESALRIRLGQPRYARKAIHVTISPPPSLYSKDNNNDYRKLRRQANKFLKIAGLRGYMLIYHPFRQNDEKEWENTPHWMKWRYSPHFHAVGYGYINWANKKHYENSIPKKLHDKWKKENPGWKNFSKKEKRARGQPVGWFVKNIGIRENIEAVIYYQLSHAGVKEFQKIISWGGILSSTRLVVAPKHKIRLDCPLCGQKFRPLKYTGRGASPLEGSPDREFMWVDANDYMYTGFRKKNANPVEDGYV